MQGEVVLVTGGSSGIGFAAARLFVARGARIWITARDEEKLRAAAANLGPSVRTFPCDVGDASSLATLAEAIRAEEGSLDTLVHSAGQLELAPAEDSTDAAERLMRINYLGFARTIIAALPLLRLGSRRSIVGLSSFVGRVVPPYWSAYAASKHAVQAYAHALRQELRRDGFHVGLVLPGPVRSPMTRDVIGTKMYPVPFGVPIISPERVAEAVLHCVTRRRAEVVVPGHFGLLLRLGSAIPKLVDLIYRPYT
jgi:short-subunit dehydrogenase